MSSTSSDDIDLAAALRGLLALQAAERDERLGNVDPRRTEVILADAGLSPGAIATVIGKKPDTVRKSIERARRQPPTGASGG